MKIGLALVLARLFGDSRHRTPDAAISRRRRTHRAAAAAHRPAARSRHRRHAGARAARDGVRCRHAPEGRRHPAGAGRGRRARRVERGPPGLSEGAGAHVRQPVARPAGRRVPAAAGPHHGGLGRPPGQGIHEGTQGQQGFLPVAHNDFIFSVLAEEHGFVGVLSVLACTPSSCSGRSKRPGWRGTGWGPCSSSGAGEFHVPGVVQRLDVGGLAPVKGLTLPLMSYGGSSVIATLAGIGLILNVRMRRFTN